MALSQKDRVLSISTPLGQDALVVTSMQLEEAIGQPFELRLELLSADGEIRFDQIVGHNVTLSMLGAGETVRHFNGYVSHFEQAGVVSVKQGTGQRHLTQYRATVVPWLWFLTRTADCRVFQSLTAPEIVKEVFREHGFTDFDDALSGTYRTRTYCVQYRETDFAFVSRLLEEEGIYYFFEHSEGRHNLVLADDYGSHEAIAGYDVVRYAISEGSATREDEVVTDWHVAQRLQPGQYMVQDFNFRKPRQVLQFNSAAGQSAPMSDLEIYDYPAAFVNDGGADDADSDEADFGQQTSRVRLEALQAQHELMTGAGRVRGLTAGGLFTLADHPRPDQNREYLVTSTAYAATNDAFGSAGSDGPQLDVRFQVIDAATPYRPAARTPRPRIHGPQTAIVVGPSDAEIWTDQHGRVKVQFHWDRYGKKDENSSCWIRVAQVWAGKAWGGINLPRIGQEVIVEFLEGDPDRPIITGRVYNGEHRTPYPLPDEQTRSGLVTRSTLEGNDQNANELRFEDKKDTEEVYFHAERDFNRVVENNDTLKVGFEKTDKGDQTIDIFNNQTLTVGDDDAEDGSQAITVKNNRTLTVKEGDETVTLDEGNQTTTLGEGDQTTTIKKGNRATTLSQGNDELTISQGSHTITVSAGKSTIEAGQEIELKVGGSKITVSQKGIEIDAPQITITGKGKVDVGSPMTTVKGDGMMTVKGGIVKIN
ncbi:MAG: type VI secretion system tip protein TssI/VgrG [Phycisphaeraceae bacterium]